MLGPLWPRISKPPAMAMSLARCAPISTRKASRSLRSGQNHCFETGVMVPNKPLVSSLGPAVK